MDYPFFNKHILVTGATSGIGQQNSWDLIRAKATLSLIGRDALKFEAIKKNLKGSSNIPLFFSGDLTKEVFLKRVSDSILPIDGLVLCAGIIDYSPVKFITSEKIERIFDLNFKANVLLIQKLLSGKKINNGASIVIVSSISSKIGVPGTALYAASKAAINSFAKVLASELSHKRIRVNVILAGVVKTRLVIDQGKISEEDFIKAERSYPLGYGSTQDISKQIMYFLSDDSHWITGSEVVLDGGYLLNK